MTEQITNPLPHLRRSARGTQLIVDGAPFLALGGEAHNSSAASMAALERVWERAGAAACNCVIAPVYWELLEPEEGVFDFSLVDGMLEGARRHGMRLILLWFGTWKNAISSYVPAWVKTDVARFPRAETAPGVKSACISPFSREACRCDARAYAALLRHLREVDGVAHTVIMMQVENEAGLLGAPRDYSAPANAAYAGPAPAALHDYLTAHCDTLTPELAAAWQPGAREATWADTFGEAAPEVFMAWHVARFIEEVTAAGRVEYPLPAFANAWLVQQPGQQPGGYPSGGPVARMLDVWRAAAPSIDALAPDIYLPNFQAVCAEYARNGNPLIIPEARKPGAEAAVFPAIGTYNALAFAPFGLDSLECAAPLAESYSALAAMMPLITALQGTGRMLGFASDAVTRVQAPDGAWTREMTPPLMVTLGGYHLTVEFPGAQDGSPGRGLICAVSDTEYYIVAAGCTIIWRAKPDDPRRPEFLSVDEGQFVDGQWQHARRLNGDEACYEHLSFGPALAQRRVVLHSFA